MIRAHPVYIKTRRIENNQQCYVEHKEFLELYKDGVVAPSETFALHEVHDVSYKALSGTYGFLYLHTIRGVRTFMVKEHPEGWMKALKTRI